MRPGYTAIEIIACISQFYCTMVTIIQRHVLGDLKAMCLVFHYSAGSHVELHGWTCIFVSNPFDIWVFYNRCVALSEESMPCDTSKLYQPACPTVICLCNTTPQNMAWTSHAQLSHQLNGLFHTLSSMAVPIRAVLLECTYRREGVDFCNTVHTKTHVLLCDTTDHVVDHLLHPQLF